MEMGTALREADSALQTPRSSSNCAKQLQERNTSRNGKMFPLIFLGLVPSKKSPGRGRGAGAPHDTRARCRPREQGQQGNVRGVVSDTSGTGTTTARGTRRGQQHRLPRWKPAPLPAPKPVAALETTSSTS